MGGVAIGVFPDCRPQLIMAEFVLTYRGDSVRSKVVALVSMACIALASCSAPTVSTPTTVGTSDDVVATSPTMTVSLERSAPELEIVEPLAVDLAHNLAALGVDAEGADCVAKDLVTHIGPERATELDAYEDEATNDDWVSVLDDRERKEFLDSLDRCVGLSEMFRALYQSGDDGITSSQATCIIDNIGDDSVRTFFNAALAGLEPPDDVFDAVVDALGACGVS
jgi:hypothetical protein